MPNLNITSEVAGQVWKIQAAVGQRVATDESVMIIEAMKMEIPIDAPRAGVIMEITVHEGETIKEGQIVARLEA
ncbi:acetyl-CoA carboxylase biotin carboxyl carrier protein subunit [Limnohabitans sp. Rim8]|jgi:acetyl-CoA carboxylase biotin carboxyl carrier protein|uniref:acetyl-CoA carboxylase biotin carboxyl carrier protein subunit n=1 Tax=Limnohabitans sp. Rim8 TaxID=1100718 RepID=UPI0025FE4276|nr:acetyl-CoA carboxylase biotin carboxyl carrier protein subunit [Limnohabitans sp. Rim8]